MGPPGRVQKNTTRFGTEIFRREYSNVALKEQTLCCLHRQPQTLDFTGGPAIG